LQTGQTFVLHSDGAGREVIFLFFQPSNGADSPGTLHWVPATPSTTAASVPVASRISTDRARTFFLNEIRQMRAGKESTAFSRASPSAASVPSSHCLSLSSSSGAVWNLEALSADVREMWMKSLHQVLVRHGLHAQKEQATAAAAASAISPAQNGMSSSVAPAVSAAASPDARSVPGSVDVASAESTSAGSGAASASHSQSSSRRASGQPGAATPVAVASVATPVAAAAASPRSPVAGSSYHAAIQSALEKPGLGGSPSPRAAQLQPLQPQQPLAPPALAAAAAAPGLARPSSLASETRALPAKSADHQASIGRTIHFSDPTDFFQLQSKIGEGSYGSVYKALDRRDNSQVAIKVLAFQGRDSLQLRKEIHILKQCDSPYIVGYKGAFQKGQNLWIVLQYCSAGSLSDIMQICNRTFSEAQVAVIMKHALRGLAYLHSQKKIHRDIKGGNILVDAHARCMLADFGVSSNLDKTLGKNRTVIGTPHWMAPEVLTNDDYNELADCWSLGITAYELAIGEPPHAKLHSMRAAIKIPTSPPPTLPEPQHFSPNFHSFLACCLVKDFTARPSAATLLTHPFIQMAPAESILMDNVRAAMAELESRHEALDEITGLMASSSKAMAGGGGTASSTASMQRGGSSVSHPPREPSRSSSSSQSPSAGGAGGHGTEAAGGGARPSADEEEEEEEDPFDDDDYSGDGGGHNSGTVIRNSDTMIHSGGQQANHISDTMIPMGGGGGDGVAGISDTMVPLYPTTILSGRPTPGANHDSSPELNDPPRALPSSVQQRRGGGSHLDDEEQPSDEVAADTDEEAGQYGTMIAMHKPDAQLMQSQPTPVPFTQGGLSSNVHVDTRPRGASAAAGAAAHAVASPSLPPAPHASPSSVSAAGPPQPSSSAVAPAAPAAAPAPAAPSSAAPSDAEGIVFSQPTDESDSDDELPELRITEEE